MYSDCYFYVMLTLPDILKMFMEKNINQNNPEYQENKLYKISPWPPRIFEIFKPDPVIKKIDKFGIGTTK